MTPVILRKPRLTQDLIDHYAFIAQDKIAPAERFLRVAEEAFHRLADMPAIGTRWHSRHPALHNVYVYPLPAPYRNYLVFYRPIPQGIDLWTILHGARNLEKALREIIKSP